MEELKFVRVERNLCLPGPLWEGGGEELKCMGVGKDPTLCYVVK